MKILKSSEVQRQREIILERQEGKCLICNRECLSPVLDHHHKKKVKGTGRIRGVLCRNCNIFLGKIENNSSRYCISGESLPEVLRNIANYLEKEQYPFLHPSEKPKEPILKRSSYNKLKKELKGKYKIPEYPKSGKLTKNLEKLFSKVDFSPKFYK